MVANEEPTNGAERVPRPATPKLIKVLLSVVRQRGLDLKQVLHESHQVEHVEMLTMRQIAGLISDLLASVCRPS